jgi:hypothetical protein
MAKRSRLLRYLAVVWDRDAAKQMEQEARESLERAGKGSSEQFEEAMSQGGRKAARALTDELTREFNTKMASAKIDLAKGLIDVRQFKVIEAEAKRAFNEGILSGMERLRAEGKTTDVQLEGLARRLKQVGTEGEAGARQAGGAMDWLKGKAIAVGAAIVAAFALNRIRQFGAESIRAAEDAGREQRTLEQTLKNVGVAWADVRDEVERTAGALWDTHRLTGGEVNVALRELTIVTGDYATAVRYLGLVADVAAGTNSSLEKAAQRVGRVLQGDVGWMRRFGLEAKGTADAMALLQERYTGAAKANTTATDTLRKVWGEFQEEVGRAMLEAGGGSTVIETLTGVIIAMTGWVERNRGTIGEWSKVLSVGIATAEVLLDIAGRVAALFRGTFQGAVALATKGLAFLADGVALAIRGIATLNDLIGRDNAAVKWRTYANEIDEASHALKRFAENAIDVAAENVGHAFRVPSAHGQTGTPQQTAVGGGAGGGGMGGGMGSVEAAIRADLEAAKRAGKDMVALMEEQARERDALAIDMLDATLAWEAQERNLESARTLAATHADIWRDSMQGVETAAQMAAMGVTQSWAGAFQRMMEDGKLTGDTIKGVFAGMGAAVLGALAQMAAGKVAENIALAFEQTAKGMGLAANPLTAPLAPIAFASAKGHLVSAAKWAALGAVAGGAAGAVSGAGGGRHGYTSPASDPAGRQLDRAEAARTPAIIYIDPFNPANPVHVRQIAKGMELDVRLGGKRGRG